MKNLLILLCAGATLTSCVSAKVYKDLESKYQDERAKNRNLSEELADTKSLKDKFEAEANRLQSELDEATAQRDDLARKYAAAKSNLENLQESYDALETNSSARIAENAQKNRELLSELEAKQEILNAEQARLERLQADLADRSRRVAELEGLIAQKDASMRALKDAISKALVDFEGKGLTVEQRDGKVYVSLENKLLFDSGSWTVGAQGRRAVSQLGSVLAQNPDIAVLIEGHTDNVPYGGSGQIKDNWDLSTKRATAIVEILNQNNSIDPKNLTAAGRGEHAPVATNDTPEGRAKNRRIEVILTPKLDEVTKLLNEI